MSDINDILSSNEENLPISEEKLQAYLEGNLSAEEQRAIELLLSEEGLESDAVEGLKDLGSERAKKSSDKINMQLTKQLSHQRRKHKGFYKNGQWSWIAVIVVLLLVVLAYLVLHYLLKS